MRRLLALATAAVLLGCILLGYGYFIEPNMLEVTTLSIGSLRLNEALAGTRLVMLADLHIKGSVGKRELRVADTLRRLDPDYVIIAGDLMGYRTRPEPVVEWLKRDLPREQVYFAVLGDTDTVDGARNCAYCHAPGKKSLRRDHPVRFLRDQFEIIETDKGRVVVAGTVPERIEPDLSFLDKAPPGLPVILISHFPEAIEGAAARHIDLVFSGDTHGGQIRAPKFLYTLFFRPGRAKYLKGEFKKWETTMYVTRGIGTSILPFRIGVKPEVVVIDF